MTAHAADLLRALRELAAALTQVLAAPPGANKKRRASKTQRLKFPQSAALHLWLGHLKCRAQPRA